MSSKLLHNFFAAFCLGFTSSSQAAIVLTDWAFNIDGNVIAQEFGDNVPSNNLLGDLGDVSVEITGAGSHFVFAYFDYEIDQANNTFFNELAEVFGTPDAGQSWEIDEPGFVFGNIYDNLFAGIFDNSNDLDSIGREDVSFGIGWDFTLTDTQSAAVNFSLSDIAPSDGFYLRHFDDQVGPNFNQTSSIYLASSLNISNAPADPPPPAQVAAPGGMFWLSFVVITLFSQRKNRLTRCQSRGKKI